MKDNLKPDFSTKHSDCKRLGYDRYVLTPSRIRRAADQTIVRPTGKWGMKMPICRFTIVDGDDFRYLSKIVSTGILYIRCLFSEYIYIIIYSEYIYTIYKRMQQVYWPKIGTTRNA